MRKVIEFLKKRSLFQVAGILIVLGILIVYLMSQYVDSPKDPATSFVSGKIEAYKDELGEDRGKVETNKSSVVSGITKEDYDRVKKALDLKEGELLAMTNLTAKLTDSIKLVRVTLDEQKNKVWEWEKKYASGSVIKSKMSEKDSVLYSSVDIKTQTTDFVKKGGLFGKDKYYTDFYSPDQNIKFNGAETFRKETIVNPKRFGLGFQVGYGITEDLKPSMYVGFGLSYNFARF